MLTRPDRAEFRQNADLYRKTDRSELSSASFVALCDLLLGLLYQRQSMGGAFVPCGILLRHRIWQCRASQVVSVVK